MRENNLKKIWAAGGVVVNGWCAIPSGFSAEVMAQCGWDSITIDMQHGIQDYQSVVQCMQAIWSRPVTPLVRVPWNDPATIMKVLDAGAMGIICPMINTRAEAEALVKWCRYPPLGQRSNGPIRIQYYGGPEYWKLANQTITVIPMIETAEAVANIDDILSVPGLDALYIGPSDLAFSMGRTPKLDQDDPVVVEAIERILAAAKRHKMPAGLHNASADYALKMIAKGFQFVSIMNDSGLMAQAANNVVKALRAGLGQAAASVTRSY